ncbi:DNA replication/repair protein RecF [Sphingomonas sp.]|jgi:DNA replication and repair protein RecF|uniref:DNA replication/repair protein RecF n=1 Tax=Sphingomonas sp. TaxID=28214 RepID=UPI002E35DB64|nr:DNA replication/repair protein RecF [Sphingomonas sp.]HEX4695285.1 DNA replication/repair protein RecF [Sphingomonas sp.]
MLSRLMLTDFRNHAEAVLHPGRGFVVLTGENGAGKTNVLEAVSLLAPGRGLRRAPLAEMARQGGSGGFGVAATLSQKPLPFRSSAAALSPGQGQEQPNWVGMGQSRVDGLDKISPTPNPSPAGEGQINVGTGTQPSAPDRRVVRINGATHSATALAEWLTVLWLTPAMDRLFVEPASERRRFLDRLTLAMNPSHAHHANRYEAAMRARNRLLADAGPEGRPDPAWLTALEAQMAEHGAAIDVERRETVAALADRLGNQPEGPFARAKLAIEGWHGADTLAADLAGGRRRDAAAGRTLVGPHRSDLVVTHLEKDQPAALCSTGEQKALLLNLVLAHAELVADRTGRAPVLLLDEIAAHLDPVRRAALFGRLAATGSQVWMTGTETAPFDGVGEATWLTVAQGRIREPDSCPSKKQ